MLFKTPTNQILSISLEALANENVTGYEPIWFDAEVDLNSCEIMRADDSLVAISLVEWIAQQCVVSDNKQYVNIFMALPHSLITEKTLCAVYGYLENERNAGNNASCIELLLDIVLQMLPEENDNVSSVSSNKEDFQDTTKLSTLSFGSFNEKQPKYDYEYKVLPPLSRLPEKESWGSNEWSDKTYNSSLPRFGSFFSENNEKDFRLDELYKKTTEKTVRGEHIVIETWNSRPMQ